MIGAFSDLHGNRVRWAKMYELAQKGGANLLICAGDVTPMAVADHRAMLIIYGNHDNLEEVRSQPRWLHDGVNKHQGYTVYAINGNYAKTAKRPHHKDSHILNALFKACKEETVDIAVTHEPPGGVLWRGGREFRSICSELVTDFILGLKPKVWIYGHCYIENPIQLLKWVTTVNMDNRFALITSKLTPETVTELGRNALEPKMGRMAEGSSHEETTR